MNHYKNSQAGGTLVGLIIGLIIGLGIAVGVAMTIKNTPLPFTNKTGKADRGDKTATAPQPAPAVPAAPSAPAAAQAPAVPTDPNRALYGNRDAARQAAKDVPRKTDEQKAADDELEARIQEAQREATARAEARAKADAAKPPVIDKSLTDKGDAPDEKFTYYLQAGAFLDQSDAENAKAKLALMGLSATVSERKTDNGVLYRVRVGPYGKVETVNRVRSRLSDNGVDVAVVRVPK